jgi:hypothetical protein
LPKFNHCSQPVAVAASFVLTCEPHWQKRFKLQVMNTATCPKCKKEVRAWYGIQHDGLTDYEMHSIRPRKFSTWDSRKRSAEQGLWPGGVLLVKAQRYWDGIPLGAMTMQRVQ